MAIANGGYTKVYVGTGTQADPSSPWVFTANTGTDVVNIGVTVNSFPNGQAGPDAGQAQLFGNNGFTFPIGNPFNFLVLASGTDGSSEWYLLWNGVNVPNSYLLVSNTDATFDGSNVFTSAELVDNPDTVCFLEGTRILTRAGYWPVESLEAGDEVMTLNHGWQPVQIGRASCRERV